MRGEDLLYGDVPRIELETPPRAWGRQVSLSGTSSTRRNTPTCVGKTIVSTVTVPFDRKHPHVRGEDCLATLVRNLREETPPRAWGRLQRFYAHLDNAGNTPTCVGKTLEHRHFLPLRWKHPHVRGEDYDECTAKLILMETPPRAWGRHQHIVKEREFNHNIHVLRQF